MNQITLSVPPVGIKDVGFFDTFGKNELEKAAYNFVVICKKIGHWTALTWTEYKKHCTYKPSRNEWNYLLELFDQGYMDRVGRRRLAPNEYFVQTLIAKGHRAMPKKGNHVRLDTKPTGQTARLAPLTVGNTYEVVDVEGNCVVTTTDEPNQIARYHYDRVTIMG